MLIIKFSCPWLIHAMIFRIINFTMSWVSRSSVFSPTGPRFLIAQELVILIFLDFPILQEIKMNILDLSYFFKKSSRKLISHIMLRIIEWMNFFLLNSKQNRVHSNLKHRSPYFALRVNISFKPNNELCQIASMQ